MSTPTLNSVDLSKCETIVSDKSANIIPFPMPTGDSDETEVFDMLGVTRILTVTGTFTGSTVSAVKTKVDAIEALADGEQDTSVDFVSDQTGTISVKVASITTTWELPGFVANYEIKLIEGV